MRPASVVRRSRVWRAMAVVIGALALGTLPRCERPSASVGGETPGRERGTPGARFEFEDVAAAKGLTRANVSGGKERLFIIENLGSGVALLDFDGDGRTDIFVNNAGTLAVAGAKGRRLERHEGPGAALYRQEAGGRFTEVSTAAGVEHRGWGTGAAVGDIDNDGDLELFVGGVGVNHLYVNNGDGTFSERTAAAGLPVSGFTSSAAFLDSDRDGFLDLYVARYVEFSFDAPPNDGRPCTLHGGPISCGPSLHAPQPDSLYRNLGDGTFEDVTVRAGLGTQPGAYGLGVCVGDVDRNGWPDIYVANDTTANFLWLNRGDGSFDEDALVRGVALSENAQGQSGMGVDMADVDGDGWPDIHVTNYSEEPNAYYQSDGGGYFSDRSALSGISNASFLSLGWGCRFADLDLDGKLDLVVANGHVHPRAAELAPGLSFEQRLLAFAGGDGRFVPLEGGPALAVARNHRGLASGDIDRDGDIDIIVTLLDGPPRYLENRSPRRGSWVVVELLGSSSNREGIGARVELELRGRPPLVREVTRSGSYLSSQEAALHFGLGRDAVVENLTVHWPSGKTTRTGALPALDRRYVVDERDGSATPAE